MEATKFASKGTVVTAVKSLTSEVNVLLKVNKLKRSTEVQKVSLVSIPGVQSVASLINVFGVAINSNLSLDDHFYNVLKDVIKNFTFFLIFTAFLATSVYVDAQKDFQKIQTLSEAALSDT